LTPEPHHDNHELLSARIGITASSATAQSQVNRITTGDLCPKGNCIGTSNAKNRTFIVFFDNGNE